MRTLTCLVSRRSWSKMKMKSSGGIYLAGVPAGADQGSSWGGPMGGYPYASGRTCLYTWGALALERLGFPRSTFSAPAHIELRP